MALHLRGDSWSGTGAGITSNDGEPYYSCPFIALCLLLPYLSPGTDESILLDHHRLASNPGSCETYLLAHIATSRPPPRTA